MSSDLTSIQSILCKVKQEDLSLPEVGRRLELGTVNSDRAEHPGQVSAPRHAGKTYKAHQRKRDSETILSLAEAMYSECAADADALGFMAKMLVQTTLPHRAQPGKQYTRSDGDVTLSITDLAGVGLPYGAYPQLKIEVQRDGVLLYPSLTHVPKVSLA